MAELCITKGQIAYFFIAYARNAYISTTSQTSDVTHVFPDPDCLQDTGILAIRLQVRAKLHIFIARARNGHLSTSGQKSNVTIVFPDPDLL